MKNYLTLLRDILDHGIQLSDRTGTGTRSLTMRQLKFDLEEGFPALTTKKLHLKSVIVELLWMLRGDTNVKFLHEHGVTIWDEWADKDGNLGPVYGAQWRNWNPLGPEKQGRDQFSALLEGLKKDPYGRRHIVTAWNPDDISLMALPPCHCFFQCFVRPSANPGNKPKLSLHLYQRSADVFLGVPFNIASYATLTHLIAAHCGYKASELGITFGDVHLYNNHQDQARQQLLRSPKKLPTLLLSDISEGSDIFNLAPGQIALQNYDPHPAIRAEVSI